MSSFVKQFTTTIPILKRSGVSRAYLFGSHARGEATKKSDVDLLISFKKNKKIGLLSLVGLQLELEDLLGKKVDLITERGLCKHIQPYVEKEKKLLF